MDFEAENIETWKAEDKIKIELPEKMHFQDKIVTNNFSKDTWIGS